MKIDGTIGDHWDKLDADDRLVLLELVQFSNESDVAPEWVNVHMGSLCFVKFLPLMKQVKNSYTAKGTCECKACTEYRPRVIKLWNKFECEELLEALAKS